jgi:hypothetical protein
MISTAIKNEKGKFVALACTGDMTLAELTAALRDIQLVLAESGWNRILVDVTAVQAGPDTAELFDFAKLFWRNYPQSGRIALVVRWDQSTLSKVLEGMLRSVGVYLTVFVSEAMAKVWLVERDFRACTRSTSDSLLND